MFPGELGVCGVIGDFPPSKPATSKVTSNVKETKCVTEDCAFFDLTVRLLQTGGLGERFELVEAASEEGAVLLAALGRLRCSRFQTSGADVRRGGVVVVRPVRVASFFTNNHTCS